MIKMEENCFATREAQGCKNEKTGISDCFCPWYVRLGTK